MQQAAAEFLELGYTRIDFPESTDFIKKSSSLFDDLLEHPPPNPLCFNVYGEPSHPDLEITDIGLIHRTGAVGPDGTSYDRKVFLHTPGFRRLEIILARHNQLFLANHTALLQHNQTFHLTYQREIVRFASEIDRQTGLEIAPRVGLEDDRLRQLAYTDLRNPTSEEIGVAHYDRDGFTLAIHETDVGLEFLINGVWTPVSSEPGRPVLFAGTKFEQLTQGRTRAVRHRVRRTNLNNRYNANILRKATVFFAHIEGITSTLRTH